MENSRNKYFIEECFKIFVKKTFIVTIFYKNVFSFTNFLMEFRHVRTYGRTAKNNRRNEAKLITQWHVTIKMCGKTNKRGFTVNLGGKSIAFSELKQLLRIKAIILFFFECKFHFKMRSVDEIFY